jgi:hypothetical protein
MNWFSLGETPSHHHHLAQKRKGLLIGEEVLHVEQLDAQPRRSPLKDAPH